MQIADLCVIIFTVSFAENALFSKGYATDVADKLPRGRSFMYFSLITVCGSVVSQAVSAILLKYIFGGAAFMSVVITPIVYFSVTSLFLWGLSKFRNGVYSELKPFELLITANTATVGVIFSVTEIYSTEFSVVEVEHGFATSCVYTLFGVCGAILAFVIFNDINERIYEKRQPEAFRGLPSALVALGLIAMVFMGISEIRFS